METKEEIENITEEMTVLFNRLAVVMLKLSHSENCKEIYDDLLEAEKHADKALDYLDKACDLAERE
jgi:t-SNARE complex subunit (syntaxin)